MGVLFYVHGTHVAYCPNDSRLDMLRIYASIARDGRLRRRVVRCLVNRPRNNWCNGEMEMSENIQCNEVGIVRSKFTYGSVSRLDPMS